MLTILFLQNGLEYAFPTAILCCCFCHCVIYFFCRLHHFANVWIWTCTQELFVTIIQVYLLPYTRSVTNLKRCQFISFSPLLLGWDDFLLLYALLFFSLQKFQLSREKMVCLCVCYSRSQQVMATEWCISFAVIVAALIFQKRGTEWREKKGNRKFLVHSLCGKLYDAYCVRVYVCVSLFCFTSSV